MGHLSPEDADYRGQLLVHVGHIQAGGYTPKEAVAQLVREVAFTHLNRLVAYKMMERRGLIREAVSRGMKSPGFLFYLADHPTDERLWSGGQAETAYRHFLEWLGRTFAEEIRPLFAPHDPANPLFPPPRALDGVLTRLNAPELADIWNEDETIGWVYQYFTPDELRREARAASSAPRNSYELAFRNQFYTPRYVVEFLSDNTLGRIWYEMRQGDTRLAEQCRYLVRRPHELFLAKGEEAPVNNDQVSVGSDPSEIQNPKSEIVPVPYRQKKDPRHLKILDPAGGSGHFLLYCFDLLVTIYEEAYDDAELGSRLHADYPTLADLRRAMPGLIMRHNLHLIDIDRRATQIAALALWLRAQRAYQTWQIPADRRPPIRKANIVCAEPMPGDKKLLAEFVARLNPPLLGQLVQTVFEKMKLAGEAGSLLKIEVELREAIAAAKKEWEAEPKVKQLTLFTSEPQPQQLGFDLSGISDAEFWDKAEGLVLQALADYAAQATNGKGLARQLFAEDASKGFDFIDLAQIMFDAILMNPPFGNCSTPAKSYLEQAYPHTKNDIFATFIDWGITHLWQSGRLGAITSRTGFFLSSFESWREEILLKETSLVAMADLGQGVLDNAMVETAAYILQRQKISLDSIFFRLLDTAIDEKGETLLAEIVRLSLKLSSQLTYRAYQATFKSLPGSPISYWVTDGIRTKFHELPSLEESVADVRVGVQTGNDFRFIRCWWEVSPREMGLKKADTEGDCRWMSLTKGGRYSPYYSDIHLVGNWNKDGEEIKNYVDDSGKLRSRPQNTEYYFRAGLSWVYRTHRFSPYILPSGVLISVRGSGIFFREVSPLLGLAIGVSQAADFFIKLSMGRGGHPQFDMGDIKLLPWPVKGKSHAKLEGLALKAYEILRSFDCFDETTRIFQLPALLASQRHNKLVVISSQINENRATKSQEFVSVQHEIDAEVFNLYGLEQSDQDVIQNSLAETRTIENSEDEESVADGLLNRIFDLISWCIGTYFGRWDIRFGLSPETLSKLQGPFDPLPRCTPGMLQDQRGLPATNTPLDYPIEIDWDGILVDEPAHPDDIVRRVQQVLAIIWGERAAAIEQEACAILGVKELRGYFRKVGKGGFWDDHVKRYSKSRRKAPIYWLLQSSKGNYALWLYYHRLDKDIYYKALVNYVEPKLRLEENKLSQLLAHRATFGTGGKEAKQLEKEIARQEAFLSELRDFHDKLRAVAHLNLTPDLNDGVILNIAPLRELVPWKDAQAMWEELQAGKYEWSSVSQQLNGNSGRG